MKCDYCRRPLGLIVQRYRRMRFCSQACKAAYLQRLDTNTREKLDDDIQRRSRRQSDLASVP
jgi:hypothetical protein